jgi:WD40 repeat protein
LREIKTIELPVYHIVADLHFPLNRKNVLMSWSSDSHVRFWKVPALTPLHDWPLGGVSNLRAAIGPRGDRVAVINEEGNIGLLERGKEPETEFEVEGAKGGRVRCIRFARNGRVLATVREDLVVRLWGIEQHREAINLPIHPQDPVRLAFDQSSSRLAVGLGNGTVWLYDLSSP